MDGGRKEKYDLGRNNANNPHAWHHDKFRQVRVQEVTMTGNHLADQAQAAENRRGCCPECGRLLEVVDIKIKGKWFERLHCKICDLYFKIED